MFYVILTTSSEFYTGLDALDLRRRLGLPDKTQIYFHDERIRVNVNEEFARKYFSRNDEYRDIILRFQDFSKGDLVPMSDTSKVRMSPDMSQQRRMELILKNWSRSK